MNKKDTYYLIGIAMIAVGIFMFFKSTRISTWGFYRFGHVSTGGIIIALILLSVIIYVATKMKAAKISIFVLLAMLILSMILGTHMIFVGSVLDLFLMLVPAAAGVGLVIRATIMDKEK